MIFYSNIFIWGSKIFNIYNIMSIFKKFHHSKFDFGQIGLWLLINCEMNVTETFTDMFKHYVLQTNVAKYAKCML